MSSLPDAIEIPASRGIGRGARLAWVYVFVWFLADASTSLVQWAGLLVVEVVLLVWSAATGATLPNRGEMDATIKWYGHMLAGTTPQGGAFTLMTRYLWLWFAAAAIWWLARRVAGSSAPGPITTGRPTTLRRFVGAFLLGVSAPVLMELVNKFADAAPPVRALSQATGTASPAANTTWLYLTIFIGVAVTPVVEEVLFRGYLWRTVQQTGIRFAPLFVVSAWFLFGHPQASIVLLGPTLILGVLRQWTGALWLPVAFHVGYNLHVELATKFPMQYGLTIAATFGAFWQYAAAALLTVALGVGLLRSNDPQHLRVSA